MVQLYIHHEYICNKIHYDTKKWLFVIRKKNYTNNVYQTTEPTRWTGFSKLFYEIVAGMKETFRNLNFCESVESRENVSPENEI